MSGIQPKNLTAAELVHYASLLNGNEPNLMDWVDALALALDRAEASKRLESVVYNRVS